MQLKNKPGNLYKLRCVQYMKFYKHQYLKSQNFIFSENKFQCEYRLHIRKLIL